MKEMKYLIVLYLLIYCVPYNYGQCDRTRDSLVLVHLYDYTNGQNWTRKNLWLSTQPISRWQGITTTAQGCVEEINLPNNRLIGRLSDSLGMLSELKVLNLNNNSLVQNIPNKIQDLSKLEVLNLSSNKLDGTIEVWIGKLSNLKRLQLGINILSGNITPEIGKLTNLTTLHLNQNYFNGNLPISIGNMTNLEELILSQNDIIGTIPNSIGNLKNLRIISLTQNKMTGIIPEQIGDLPNLRFLYLDENNFSGNIPNSIGNLLALEELWLNTNNLSGQIPNSMGKLLKMKKLLLQDNNLEGRLLDEFTDMLDLISFNFSNNKIGGPIPQNIGNLKKLISLVGYNNILEGSIPNSMSQLTELSALVLNDNMLTGEFPKDFGELTKIRRLYFQNNNLEGCFPTSMQVFCALGESVNINATGYNFLDNTNLIFNGDFARWCTGEGRAKATIVTNSPLCGGSTLVLEGNGGISYFWSGPNGFVSSEQNPQIPNISSENLGQYKVVVVNENKCVDSTTTIVLPVNQVSASQDMTACLGENISLFANGGIAYKWVGPNGFVSTEQNPTLTNFRPEMVGTYVVTIITNDCEYTFSVNVDQKSTMITVENNSPVCEGNNLTLSASLGQSFLWIGPNNFTSTDRNPTISVASLVNNGTYQVLVTDEFGCRVALNSEVIISEKQNLTQPSYAPMCQTEQSLELPTSIDGINGVWEGLGITNAKIFTPTGLVGDNIIRFVPDDFENSCVNALITSIKVTSLMVETSEVLPSLDDNDTNGSMGINISGLALPPFNVDIIGSVYRKVEVQNQSHIEDNLPSGDYRVIVTDNSGCEVETIQEIRYLKPNFEIANAVSKDPTSINGSLFLAGNNIARYSMKIFDRWGSLQFDGANLQPNDPSYGWKPNNAQQGVYIYQLDVETYNATKTVFGSVTVL